MYNLQQKEPQLMNTTFKVVFVKAHLIYRVQLQTDLVFSSFCCVNALKSRTSDPYPAKANQTLYILNQNHPGYLSSKDQTRQDHFLRPDQPDH